MQEKIKKILSVFTLLCVLFPLSIDARSGCCSWHGGVCGCRCCDGTSLSSTCLPYYPECGGGGFSHTPSVPDCPSNSHYDNISGSCECSYGYVASGGQCILADQYCNNKYGYNAKYDIVTDSCECRYGYILSSGSCVDGNMLCHQEYGYSSSYDSLTDKCKCDYGYVFNSLSQCVSEYEYCRDLYGFNAEYDTLSDKCVCKKGYFVNDTQTGCIDGDTYCRNEFGSHTSYDYLSNNCKCSSSYIMSGNRCMEGNVYCQNLHGEQSSYNLLSKICECDFGYELKNNKCVAPMINNVSPLRAGVGEGVTIKGENFGDSKYDSLKLYIGFTKISSLDISIWRDDKIVFEITKDLGSGTIILKNDFVKTRGPYLEISENEQDYIYIPPTTIDDKPIISTTTTTKNQFKPEVKSALTESNPKGLRDASGEERVDIVDGQKSEEKNPEQSFLNNILITIESFFSRIFIYFSK